MELCMSILGTINQVINSAYEENNANHFSANCIGTFDLLVLVMEIFVEEK